MQTPKFLPNFPNIEIDVIERDLENEFMDMRSGYNTQKTRRMQFYRQYKFQKYGNEQVGASTFVDSTIFDAIEWMIPSLIQPFVETNKFMKVNPVAATLSNLIKAQLARELLNYQIRRKNEFYLFLHDIIKAFLIGGESFCKIVWIDKDEKIGQPVAYPKLVAVPADQIRYDWTVQNFEDSPAVTQEIDLNRSEILDLFMKTEVPTHQTKVPKKALKAGVITSRFNQAIAVQGRVSKTGYLRDEQADARNWVGETRQSNTDINKSLFLRREQWTMYDMEGNGFLEPILAVFIDDHLVQVVKNKMPDKKPPFIRAECIRDVMGNPGMGWSELLASIQEFQTGMMRMFSDNLNAQHNGFYEYDMTSVDQSAILLLQQAPPGSRTPLGTRRMGSIQPITPAPIASQAFSINEKMETAKENRSGFTRYSQGNDSNGLNQTATGITQILNRSDLRMWELSMRTSETLMKGIGRKVLSMNQAFFKKQGIEIMFNVKEKTIISANGRPTKVRGRKAGEWAQIENKDLGGYFDLELDVATKTDQQTQIDNNLQWAQNFGPYVGPIIEPEVMRVVAQTTATLMGNHEVELALKGGAADHAGSGGVSVPIIATTGAGAQDAAGGEGPQPAATNTQNASGLPGPLP